VRELVGRTDHELVEGVARLEAARRRGRRWPIFHPIELLDASIRGIAVPIDDPAPANPLVQDDKTVCNGDFGTSVNFVKSPSDAAKQALKEEKLVLVLHVSGDFEDPDFT